MTRDFGSPGIEPDEPTPSLQLSPSCGERAFGEAAALLSGAAAVLLGWRPKEFWESTPAEIAAVLAQFAPDADGPDALTIDELRRRFPDE
jgi:hypothetical protein